MYMFSQMNITQGIALNVQKNCEVIIIYQVFVVARLLIVLHADLKCVNRNIECCVCIVFCNLTIFISEVSHSPVQSTL